MQIINRVVEIKIDDKLIYKSPLKFYSCYSSVNSFLDKFVSRLAFDKTIGLDLDSIDKFTIEVKK